MYLNLDLLYCISNYSIFYYYKGFNSKWVPHEVYYARGKVLFFDFITLKCKSKNKTRQNIEKREHKFTNPVIYFNQEHLYRCKHPFKILNKEITDFLQSNIRIK